MSQASEAQVREVFDHFDADKSGSISAAEIQNALGQLGVQASAEEVAAVVKHFDKDGNSSLSFAEFVHLIREIEKAQ